MGYSQDGAFIEFHDISLVKRDEENDLIFVTESNKEVKVFLFGNNNQFIFVNEIMSVGTKDYISYSLPDSRFAMYVADNDDGLKWGQYEMKYDTTIVDIISSPDTIITLQCSPYNGIGGEITTNGKPLGIDSDGVTKIAMAVDQLGIEFYDLDAIGSEPVLSERYDLDGNAEQVEITNSGAFVSCDDFGAYYLSNDYIGSGEGSIIHFAEDLTVDHISVNNNIAALSLGSKGIALYDISNPINPEPRGIFDVGYVYRSRFWNDRLLLCTRSGLKIIVIDS
jgi:hypothetical protein